MVSYHKCIHLARDIDLWEYVDLGKNRTADHVGQLDKNIDKAYE